MDNKSLINRMNPFLKIHVLLLVTIIGSLEYNPFLPITLIILGIIITYKFSDINIEELLKSIRVFIGMSFGFMAFIILSRYLSNEPLLVITVMGLGFKIILISVYSAIFVKTTDPTEFVVSLIKYFKVHPKFAYAFLTAYRFIPTFKEEYDIIKHAYQVRGATRNKNYVIPMMATAVRKGIRISMAMETRAFGKYKTRTYYRRLKLKQDEVICCCIYVAIVISITIIYAMNGLTNMGVGLGAI
ncbi:energy-coupling factor transporter transmembrane component T family protein [Clostridium sp.]|uniref:energy-coupling factor transporter transmembrane component T family protein n=1 Tax=Clostridium sp. TaxID=1506 RepID=UPI003F3206E5